MEETIESRHDTSDNDLDSNPSIPSISSISSIPNQKTIVDGK